MKIVTQCLDELPHNLSAVIEMCIDDQVVVLTKDGQAEFLMVSTNFFNDLVANANEKEMYRELWQAEVDARQGNLISAKKALEDIDRL